MWRCWNCDCLCKRDPRSGKRCHQPGCSKWVSRSFQFNFFEFLSELMWERSTWGLMVEFSPKRAWGIPYCSSSLYPRSKIIILRMNQVIHELCSLTFQFMMWLTRTYKLEHWTCQWNACLHCLRCSRKCRIIQWQCPVKMSPFIKVLFVMQSAIEECVFKSICHNLMYLTRYLMRTVHIFLRVKWALNTLKLFKRYVTFYGHADFLLKSTLNTYEVCLKWILRLSILE